MSKNSLRELLFLCVSKDRVLVESTVYHSLRCCVATFMRNVALTAARKANKDGRRRYTKMDIPKLSIILEAS